MNSKGSNTNASCLEKLSRCQNILLNQLQKRDESSSGDFNISLLNYSEHQPTNEV